MTLHRHICLVGLPGAGKSTVGLALAGRLGCGFVDSDDEVEHSAGTSIATIFARDGETAFRKLERGIIMGLLRSPPHVVALGGGGFDDPSTRGTLLASAMVIWLDVPEDVLVERLSLGSERPLLVGHDVRQRLAELAARRHPYYAQAHLRVEASTVAEMIQVIVAAIQSDSAARNARL